MLGLGRINAGTGTGHWALALGTEHCVLGTGHQALGAGMGYRVLDTRHQILSTRYRAPGAGNQIFGTGY